MIDITTTEAKVITRFDKTKIKPGDVVSFVRKPYGISFRKYRFYGVVSEVTDDTLWVYCSTDEPSENQDVRRYGFPVEFATEIDIVIRNGVKP